MLRPLAFVALLMALAGPAFAATDDELKTALVGAWSDVEGCTGARLVFKADGTFTTKSGPTEEERNGTYAVQDGKLTGKGSDGSEMPVVALTYDGTSISFQGDGGATNKLFPCSP